jgi:DNA-binding transcriptional LysR family regulator
LSVQVRKCERYLELDIFARDKHRVEVTPIGIQLVSHARTALRVADAIMSLRSQPDPSVGAASNGDANHQSRVAELRR